MTTIDAPPNPPAGSDAAQPATCMNGHRMSAGERFCRRCGAPLAIRCPNDHLMAAKERTCRACATPMPSLSKTDGVTLTGPNPEVIADDSRGVATPSLAPSSPTRTRRRDRPVWIGAAIVGAFVVLAGTVGVTFAFTRSTDDHTMAEIPATISPSPTQSGNVGTLPATPGSAAPAQPQPVGTPVTSTPGSATTPTVMPLVADCTSQALSQAVVASGEAPAGTQVVDSHFACVANYAEALVAAPGLDTVEAYYHTDSGKWTVLTIGSAGITAQNTGIPVETYNQLDAQVN